MRKPITLRRAETRAAARAAAPGDDAVLRERQTAQIARIDDLTRAGRANWFGLLAYLAFTLITALAVQDADFFIDSRQTQLPLIGVAIPTVSFFVFAPILGAALHVYLHLLIRKSTEALAEPAPIIRGRPLETHVLPWLLNDLVLRGRGDGAAIRRPLDWLAGVTAMALIWFAAPYVLALMWVISLPAHDAAMSLTIALCLGVSAYASLQSWVKMRADLRRPWLASKPASVAVFAVSFLAWLALSGLTILSTEGGLDRLTGDDRPRWAKNAVAARGLQVLAALPLPDWARDDRLIAPADLRGVVFAELPPDQADYHTARDRFRKEWCDRHGLRADVCGPATDPPAYLPVMRQRWCSDREMPEASECQSHFADLDTAFHTEWRAFRRQTLAALEKPDLTGRDLRRADLSNIQFPGVNFFGAQIEQASFSKARMEGANLGEAQMERTLFLGAQMEGAYLQDAQMEGAVLLGARMDDAFFFGAQMAGTDLSLAQMAGAQLREAQMDGTLLMGTQFDEVTGFRPASMRGAGLNQVDLAVLAVDPDVLADLLADTFGDASVTLPPGMARPAGWSDDYLGWDFDVATSPFHIAWRAHQASIGFVPPAQRAWLAGPGPAPPAR